MAAQFGRLENAGISIHHVDGHHHLHMHPLIFEVLCREASQRDINWIRIPREPLQIMTAFRSPSRGVLPFIEWAVFGILGRYNGWTARKYGMLSAPSVCGLSASGNIDEHFFLNVLPHVSPSFTEIYTHPDKDTPLGQRELAALVSSRVIDMIKALQILPVGYNDFPLIIKTPTARRRCNEDIYSDIIGDLECRNR
ncbi:MAG: ChbG/HpnK family deacetylase [Dissulfurispiraceae bacterium]